MLCFTTVHCGALQLAKATALGRFLKTQFRTGLEVIMFFGISAGSTATSEQGDGLSGGGSGCFLRMQKAGVVFLALFPLSSSSSPKPFLSGSQCDESSMHSEPPQRQPGVSQAGGWMGTALPGCQPAGQPEEAAPIPVSPVPWNGDERWWLCRRDRLRLRVAAKNPLLSEGLHLALLEVWSRSASLQRKMLRGEAGQIGDGWGVRATRIYPHI